MTTKLAAVIIALVLAACGASGARSSAPVRVAAEAPVLETAVRLAPQERDALAAQAQLGRWYAGLRRTALERWNAAVATNAARAASRVRPGRPTRDAAHTSKGDPGKADSLGVSEATGSCPSVPAYISQRESRCTYTALNPSGAGGAYQLMPSTADALARRMGRPDLVGRNPSTWAPADQDAAAALLWNGGLGACNWTPPNYCA